MLVNENKTFSVVGIGRLGLCFALYLEKCGYHIIGIDINKSYVDLINNKKLKSPEPLVEDYLNSAKNFHATTNIREVLDSNIIFILVNTSHLSNGKFNESSIDSIVQQIVQFGKQEKKRHVVILSTVNPGYCDKIATRLEPLNYNVVYNPEFLAQGTVFKNLQNPDMIIIGEQSTEAGDKLQEIYKNGCVNKPSIHRMSRISAEIAKIAYNCFSTTKISFANSIGDLALKVGAEPNKILNALGSDSKIGKKCFKYGFGYGGPCLPKDNRALIYFASEKEMELPISLATDETNKKHLEFQFEEYSKNFQKDQAIIFYGVAYKKGTTILEDSQQLALAVKLAKAGHKVYIKDSLAVIDKVKEMYPSLFEFQPIEESFIKN